MMKGALRSALSAKLRDGELQVVKDFSFSDHKTKTVNNALVRFDSPKTVLLIDNSDNRNLKLGSRNIPGVTLLESKDVNPYHLLGAKRVLISETAAKRLSEGLS
jgi:large subunit ribosomal protein L4